MTARPLKTLERVLSKAGAGSRVDARRWIRSGRVKVNGQAVRDPDTWVDMKRDRVRLDGKPLQARERVYLLLYKPAGYLTTYRDPQSRPTVYDLIADLGTFVSPVGRLDLDTSGVGAIRLRAMLARVDRHQHFALANAITLGDKHA